MAGPYKLQGRVTPAANTVTALVTVPRGKVWSPIITIRNGDTVVKNFQCFHAYAGVAHNDNQAVSPVLPIDPGQVLTYPIAGVVMYGGDILRVRTNGDGTVTFSVSSNAVSEKQ
jgi:hypothetical protein